MKKKNDIVYKIAAIVCILNLVGMLYYSLKGDTCGTVTNGIMVVILWNSSVPKLCEKAEEGVGMDLNEYQKAAMRTAGTNNKDNLLLNGVMGLNGEAGECIDIVKKHMFQGHELNKDKLKDELGDVFWYLAVTAEAMGFSLSDIAECNIEKLRRRYPDGFDSERSINRTE